MSFIKLKKEETVTLQVTITGLIDWSYEYYDQEKIYKGNSKDSQNGTTNKHALGMPAELDHHVNNWGIMIANRSAQEQDFSIELEWIQDGNVISKWVPKDKNRKIKPEQVKSYGDTTLLVIE